eukprot:1155695-Pelagomonas_calceolata.AAC.2
MNGQGLQVQKPAVFAESTQRLGAEALSTYGAWLMTAKMGLGQWLQKHSVQMLAQGVQNEWEKRSLLLVSKLEKQGQWSTAHAGSAKADKFTHLRPIHEKRRERTTEVVKTPHINEGQRDTLRGLYKRKERKTT